MGYMLITVRKILHIEIITESFNTREDAFNKMKAALSDRLKLDGDEDLIYSLEASVELSNAVLNDNDAYIYQDSGETYHHWKIVQVSTAYDIDKVVDKLGDYGNEECSYYAGTPYEAVIKECVDKAIEIVKQGGVTDDVCEWHKVKNGNAYKCNTHAEIHDSRVLDWCCCPYCSKKIKVVE